MLCREFRMGQQDIFSKLISTIFCTVVLCSLRIVYDFDKFRHFYPLLFDRWSSDQKRSTLLCPDILTQGCNAYANTYHRPYWTQVGDMSRMYRFLLDVSSQQSSSAGLLELELALATYILSLAGKATVMYRTTVAFSVMIEELASLFLPICPIHGAAREISDFLIFEKCFEISLVA